MRYSEKQKKWGKKRESKKALRGTGRISGLPAQWAMSSGRVSAMTRLNT